MHVKWTEVGLADSSQKAVSSGEALLNGDVTCGFCQDHFQAKLFNIFSNDLEENQC